jgi:hypothetical protein
MVGVCTEDVAGDLAVAELVGGVVAGEVLVVGCPGEVRRRGCEFSKLFLLAIRLTKDFRSKILMASMVTYNSETESSYMEERATDLS